MRDGSVPLVFIMDHRVSRLRANWHQRVRCFHDATLIVLHGFITKTQKNPADNLVIARGRMNEVTR